MHFVCLNKSGDVLFDYELLMVIDGALLKGCRLSIIETSSMDLFGDKRRSKGNLPREGGNFVHRKHTGSPRGHKQVYIPLLPPNNIVEACDR
jgi:hypothetical protein